MGEKMLAARFHIANRPLVLEEVAVPDIDSSEILVEVKSCGLCGSDVHILKGETFTGKVPITLGHESSGIIARVGSRVEGWKPGDRVVISCITSCGNCATCQMGRDSICLNRRALGVQLDGALARFMKVTPRNLVSLPDKIPFEEGAILTDAVATPYHALKSRAKIKAGESIAIFGVGGLGIHAVKLARILGAVPIFAIDISESRLDRALKCGADFAVNVSKDDPPQYIWRMTSGLGVDVALECVGKASTIRMATDVVRIGGRAAIVGLGEERIELSMISAFVRKEIALFGSSAFELKEHKELLSLVSSGRLELSDSISEVFPLSAVNDALKRLSNAQEHIVRFVINDFVK